MSENRESINIYTADELSNLVNEKIVSANIVIRGEQLGSLDGVAEVWGNFGLCDSNLKSLGDLKVVKGDFWISANQVPSELKSLENLQIVGGNLSLRYSIVTDLGKLRIVNGNMSLRDTQITSLDNLELVAGNLFLPKKLENRIDLSRVKVGGKVRYWNDDANRRDPVDKSTLDLVKSSRPVPYWRHQYIFSAADINSGDPNQREFYSFFRQSFLNGTCINVEGNSNYYFVLMYELCDDYFQHLDLEKLRHQFSQLGWNYPITKPYTERILIEIIEGLGDFETAWQSRYTSKDSLSLIDIYEFQKKLRKQLLDGELIARLAGYSHLTPFGQNYIDKIKPIAFEVLEDFESKRRTSFLDVFFSRLTVDKYGTRKLHSFDSTYYESFFASPSEYAFWKNLDREQEGIRKNIKHVPEKAVFNQFRKFLRDAEDIYRERTGMPKVGEGWISETDLYYRIKTTFPHYEVIQHAKPVWLGKQHFDIYILNLNVAIEYQGIQHYQVVEIFGGQAALEKNQERDLRKRKLSEDNGCSLIYVYEGYKIDEVTLAIKEIALSEQKNSETRHVNRPIEVSV